VRQRSLRSLLVAAAALAALAVPPAALAHATLVGTEPADESVLAEPPARVVVRFNEAVEASFGSLRVFDSSGRRVDAGTADRPEATSVAAPLNEGLADGTYTVAWRVVSADGHPVHGAFVFHLGAPGANPAGIAEQVLAEDSPSRALGAAFTGVRFLGYAGLLGAVGGILVLALALGDAPERVRRRLLGLAAGLAGLVAATSLTSVYLQGATASGLGLGASLRAAVIADVLDTRVGQAWLGRAIAAAALGLVCVALQHARRDRGLGLDAAVVLAAVLTLAPAVAGHARVSGSVEFVTDVAHVLAAAAWTGGLAFVGLALVLARDERWPLAARAVPRFSNLALGSVAVLIVCGVVNAYLQIRTWSGLWDTTYGRLVLVKAALLLPLLGLGLLNNRRAVPALRSAAVAPAVRRRFAGAVAGELALVVAVVAVTAVLVGEPPARAVVQPSGPVSAIAALGDLELNLVVDPARTGGNQVHLFVLARSGQPADVDELELTASLPAAGVGPLPLRVSRLAPGHYAALGAQLALAGTWRLDVTARRGEFDQIRAAVGVPIQ
jgi:copper transport protein